MALEIHIQIDKERTPHQLASTFNKDDTTLEEISIAIAEMERVKLKLLDLEFEDDNTISTEG